MEKSTCRRRLSDVSQPCNPGLHAEADGTTNLAAVSWWTYLLYNPGMIAYAMAKSSYSGEMMRANGEVILTVPGAAIADEVMGCGVATGRNTDKAGKLGLEMRAVLGSEIQIPVHTRVAIQCKLKEFIEEGDHYLYLGNVEQVYGKRRRRPSSHGTAMPRSPRQSKDNTADTTEL